MPWGKLRPIRQLPPFYTLDVSLTELSPESGSLNLWLYTRESCANSACIPLCAVQFFIYQNTENWYSKQYLVSFGALASHSRLCRERLLNGGLAWQREARSPSRLHSLQTRVWHPWTCPEALPLRHRQGFALGTHSRAFAPLRTTTKGLRALAIQAKVASPLEPDEGLSRPFEPLVRAYSPPRHPRRGAFLPLRSRPVFRHRLRQGARPLDPCGGAFPEPRRKEKGRDWSAPTLPDQP